MHFVARKDSRRRLAVMAAEFYFDGDCNNPEVQIEIKENFVKAIQNSAGWKSKCQTSLCNIGNVQVRLYIQTKTFYLSCWQYK